MASWLWCYTAFAYSLYIPQETWCWDKQNECMSSCWPNLHFDSVISIFTVNYSTSIFHPMSPVFMTCAIHETLKPGWGVALLLLPKSQGDALKSLKYSDRGCLGQAGGCSEFFFVHSCLTRTCSNLWPVIDSTTYSSILILYKSVPGMFPPPSWWIFGPLWFSSPWSSLIQIPANVSTNWTTRGDQMFDTLKPIHPSIPIGLAGFAVNVARNKCHRWWIQQPL